MYTTRESYIGDLRVYLPLYKGADTPFHIQTGDDKTEDGLYHIVSNVSRIDVLT